jgi:hypothetical protein
MKKAALIAALVLSVPVAMPTGATAHPSGASGGFAGTNWLIPTATEGEETPESARTTGTDAGVTKNMKLLANLPKNQLRATNSDLAFSGKYALMGNYDGLIVIDIADPASPKYVSETRCPGSQNDVSVYRHLAILSTDSQRSDNTCNSAPYNATAHGPEPWEGLKVFDWSNPANPTHETSIPTDCGSHTHTTIPDPANNRLVVYVSSYRPNETLNCKSPHDKISIVTIPLNNPDGYSVKEHVLFPAGGQASTSGCHDITAYPAKKLALGACMGEGIVMDISDPVNPKVLSTMVDPNFSFWHSATFSDDADTAVFTDELGGGTRPECEASDPGNRGADAFYDISDPKKPVLLDYFKIQDLNTGRVQTSAENCVSHNGSLIPTKDGRDMMVQAWYQGGTSVIDFTDPKNVVEVGYFDRPADPNPGGGGHWSSYYYNGKIYASEIGRGFDVLNLAGPFDAGGTRQQYFNAQTQEPLYKK